jgi:hypothetical protein
MEPKNLSTISRLGKIKKFRAKIMKFMEAYRDTLTEISGFTAGIF